MEITSFTPFSAIGGGLLIGTATTLLLALNGRVAGISGIAGGLIGGGRADWAWRLLFLVGLLVGAGAYGLIAGVPVHVSTPLPLVILGGVLVGFGTQLGSGCTSGHGLCGLARFSPRSLVATAIFMVVAVLTVFVTRHVLGL